MVTKGSRTVKAMRAWSQAMFAGRRGGGTLKIFSPGHNSKIGWFLGNEMEKSLVCSHFGSPPQTR